MAYEWDEARATSAFDQNGVCLGIDDVSAQDPCCLTFDRVIAIAPLAFGGAEKRTWRANRRVTFPY